MAEEYVTICVACTKGVARDNMQYVNGRVFHPECYQKYGKDFLVVDQDLAKKTARLKIDLVQLKNLKVRNRVREPTPKKSIKKTKRKATKKTRVRKTKRTPKRTKARKVRVKKTKRIRQTGRKKSPKRTSRTKRRNR